MQNSKLSGFTLTEILIVVSIVTVIASFGVIVGIDSYQRSLFHSQTDDVLTLLEKARSNALNNMGSSPTGAMLHGVHFTSSDATLFRTNSDFAGRQTAYDLKVSFNSNTGASGLTDVVFQPLTGEAIGAGTLNLSEGPRSTAITVNSEGGISW